MFEAWRTKYLGASLDEGWSIIDVGHGSRYGRWQFHKPSEKRIGQTALWGKVLMGTQPHHEAAIQLILVINPREFDYWCRGARDAGADLSKVPEHRRPLVVASLLTE